MPKSSRRKAGGKPAKPRPDFPLYAHATGRWAKRIKGRIHYFGPWRDPQAALERYLETKDDLLAGRVPSPKGGGLSVTDLANHFLTYKLQLVDSGELATRTFDRYKATCGFVLAVFGKTCPVGDLRPQDFQALRGHMAKRWGPVALANEIQNVRSLFRYGEESGLFDHRVRFGPGFKKPSAKTIRQTRAANGPKMFTPDQIHSALDHAVPNLRAMVLLGVNAALGNTDLGLLPIRAADLGAGWLDYPRAKTAIDRHIPLWPETVDSIRQALAARPEPKDPEDAALLFIGPRGTSYVGNHRGYRVTAEWRKLAKKAGIEGRTFYDLRRTFQTIAEGARDLVAVQAVMGHAPASGDMSSIYRQRVDDERLLAVTNHVRQWVFELEGNE